MKSDSAVNKPLVWIDAEGGMAAFVFDEGFSAVRDSKGDWRSPSPPVTVGSLDEDGFRLACDHEAETLLKAARMSASASPVRAK